MKMGKCYPIILAILPCKFKLSHTDFKMYFWRSVEVVHELHSSRYIVLEHRFGDYEPVAMCNYSVDLECDMEKLNSELFWWFAPIYNVHFRTSNC